MKVVGLDGKTYTWKLVGHTVRGSDAAGSSYHKRARKLLSQLFPSDIILEEVALPGTKGLRADYVLQNGKLMVEVQGRQHRVFVGHFHKHGLGFLQSLERDQKKREWCERNGIRLVSLQYDDTDERWRDQILGRPADAGLGQPAG